MIPLHEFQKCVQRYYGDYKVRKYSCLDQFFCLAFAQLTYRESLRDIVSCLKAVKSRLYHTGIRGRVSRNNLANANEVRDWRIYADFAQVLIAEARRLYREEDIGLELKNTVYAFDSTTIACVCRFSPGLGSANAVELFFHWIKQNLQIKSFYGTSENAVRTQIWVAITVHVLVAIIRKRLDLQVQLYTFLQILSFMAFEKTPLNQLLTETNDHESMADDRNQLLLFNL